MCVCVRMCVCVCVRMQQKGRDGHQENSGAAMDNKSYFKLKHSPASNAHSPLSLRPCKLLAHYTPYSDSCVNLL